MFVFTGNLVQLSFNKDKYIKTLDETLKRQIRNAAREWLRAVLPRVPVWTGTARGTLLPLSRMLNVRNQIKPIKKKRGFGPNVGSDFGEFAFLDGTNGEYGFAYEINLAYFQENEFSPAPPKYKLTNPTPWHSFLAGDKAFHAYLDEILPKRLPKLNGFIEVTSNIKIG